MNESYDQLKEELECLFQDFAKLEPQMRLDKIRASQSADLLKTVKTDIDDLLKQAGEVLMNGKSMAPFTNGTVKATGGARLSEYDREELLAVAKGLKGDLRKQALEIIKEEEVKDTVINVDEKALRKNKKLMAALGLTVMEKVSYSYEVMPVIPAQKAA